VCTGAARLWLSVDHCCPKYEEKEEKGEGRKERQEAVEAAGGCVIRSAEREAIVEASEAVK